MYLKRLELNGFKSFAKKTTLLFDTPITGIVGPNGSGKSNVAEAFRWSLGEQSMKSLRGKRGEDLIFNGSRTLPRMNRAGVTLVFDNTKRQFDIEFSDVSITREVYRDGTNSYGLNDSKVRLRDIIELLSQVSLGASSHHIISQNEADRILSATAKVRKMMIEDALGLRIYHWKISESERKLEKTKENIKEASSLRREISGHLRFLSKEAEKIEKAKDLKTSLLKLYEKYIGPEKAYIDKERGAIEKEKKEPKRELVALDGKLENLSPKKSSDETEGGDDGKIKIFEEGISKIRSEKDELRRTLGRLEGMIEISNVRGEERHDATEHSFSQEEVHGLLKKVDEILEKESSSSDLDALKTLFVRIRDVLRGFREATDSSSNEDVEKKNEELKKELSKLEDEKRETEEKLSGLTERESELTHKKSELEDTKARKAFKKLEDERSYFEAKERHAQLQVILESIKTREERLRAREDEFEKECGEMKVFFDLDTFNKIIEKDYGTQKPDTELRKEITRHKIRIEEVAPAGEEVFTEYEEAKKRDEFLEKEINDLEESAKSLKKLTQELQEKLNGEFVKGIGKINKEFQHFFELMFGGGKAHLELISLERSKEPEEGEYEETEDGEEGISISVSLPRKKIRGLEMLSGGERSLTSIALLFAMSQVNPPPFLILDETDAALDEANSKKYGDMLENLSKKTQLILITHNRETMSRAGVLYGVTMGNDGVSKLLSVKFDEAVQIAK